MKDATVLGSKTFQAFLKQGAVCVVFHRGSLGCERLLTALDSVVESTKGKLKWGSVDTGTEGIRFKIGPDAEIALEVVPTLVLIQNGKLIAINKDDILCMQDARAITKWITEELGIKNEIQTSPAENLELV